MSMRIFDTIVLIDYLKNKQAAVDCLKQCVREGDQLACSVITVTELLTGIRPGEKEVFMRFFMLSRRWISPMRSCFLLEHTPH